MVQSQPRQIVHETLSQKNLSQKKKKKKNRSGGVAQGEGSEFKPQYCKTDSYLWLPHIVERATSRT
jgi:hypothetical protein